MQTIDLFEQVAKAQNSSSGAGAPITISLRKQEPEERARRRITSLLKLRHIPCLAFSSGKDSSATADLLLRTARDLKLSGVEVPPIIITHSSTGIENPVVSRMALSELKKMVNFGRRHHLDVRTLVGEPDLNSSWPVRVIGGRALPSFPGGRADCSIDFKVSVGRRLLKQAAQLAFDFKNWNRPVVITGVRSGESTARDQRIAHRNETAEGTWTNDDGDLRASPILDFTEDDVWEVLGLSAAGINDSYSDFGDVMDFYRASGGSSCVIVADMKMNAHQKPCSARSGCWACTRVGTDKSVETMIESDEKAYGFIRPLNRLRNWISNTQYDWSMRQYVGRTISNDGFIEIGADTYSPKTLRKLLIYTLTAEKLSGVPIISPQQLVAIDLRWSLYGLFPPFSALKTYFEVVDQGMWEEAPIAPHYRPVPVPKIGRIHVGSSWYEVTGMNSVSGLRDLGAEVFHESCGQQLKTLANGALVADYEEGDKFEVDEEAACDFLVFMAEDYIRDYCREDYPDWTEGFRTYMRLGMVSIGKGQSRTTDEILRRTQWRQANELHGQRTLEELQSRCAFLYERQQQLL